MRELPAVRPNQPILTSNVFFFFFLFFHLKFCFLPAYNYYIEIDTGMVEGAQTSANVYLQIFGQRGDTGRRLLHKNIGGGIKWQPGQTDKFSFDAVDLSTITKWLAIISFHNLSVPNCCSFFIYF